MSGKLIFSEKNGDLFSSPPDYALAHCVTTSMTMGGGIARIFKSRFGRVQELKDQKVQVGGVAILKDDKRYIYYLVTKDKLYLKPKYEHLKSTLQEMKKHMIENGVTKLAIPKIGCGIDGLDWDKVKQLLYDVFDDEPMEIVVYVL